MNARTVSIPLFILFVAVGGEKPSLSPIEGKSRSDIRNGDGYGMRLHPTLNVNRLHEGADFNVPEGTPVRAAAEGKVIAAKNFEGYGLMVIIQHADGYRSRYAHLSKIMINRGATVNAGEIIGATGHTGQASSSHLHYEIWKNGKSLNPTAFLPQ